MSKIKSSILKKPSPIPAKISALQRASSVFFLISCVPDRFRAFLKKNFRYSMGAPWAGAQGASEAAVFSILPELATQRDGPRRPGESEILFEKCSKIFSWLPGFLIYSGFLMRKLFRYGVIVASEAQKRQKKSLSRRLLYL